MGYAVRPAADRSLDLCLEDLLDAAQTGALPGARVGGRRARRRATRARLAEAGAVAAILGVEGCLPVTGDGPDMTAPERPGGGASLDPAPAGEGDGAAAGHGDAIEIPVAELLSDYPGAQRIVKIFGADNGVAELKGSVVHFTPNAGFEGAATIRFSYVDSRGRVQRGEHEVEVTHNDGHDHGAGDPGGAGGHDHGDAPAGHDPNGPHGDDPSKQAEHLALMALVPVDEATHIAVKSGSWFDPATWANGEVPGTGAKVLIPEGMTVAYDGESPASIFTIRVDGELDFATDRDTFLEVDTLVVTKAGHLTIGTVDNPVAVGVEAVIQIAQNGPIDVAWDPMLLSRGVISHGEIDIHGAEKENFIRVLIDPMKGATSITLDSPPDGWQVGDKLVLTGTHLSATHVYAQDDPRSLDTTEDEELIITGISGNKIFFDHPLQYDHEGARADLKAYLANYTRNVRIETEGGDSVPVHQRGHVMFMHSDNIDVRYAEFDNLGRTDKSERAFDFADLDHTTSDSNLKGRYALHIHRAGVGDPDNPAMIVGNAVWGSPGWGYVHHDSNAILASNNAYDVFGAAFVAEAGNETGRWVDNISIKTIGVETGSKDGEDVTAFDLGRNGAGFWFQGRLVDAVDNVAAGSPGGHGFVYMHRAPADEEVTIDPATALQSDKLRYVDASYISPPNIGVFSGNEAIAVFHGLQVIKPGPQQGHDVRTVLENFTAWEVIDGIGLEYTGHYTIKNAYLVATDQNIMRADTSNGLTYGTNAFDMVVNGARIEGFQRGVLVFHDSLIDGVADFRYFFIDIAYKNNGSDYMDLGYDKGSTAKDRFLSADQLHQTMVSYDSVFGDGIPKGPANFGAAPLVLDGVKTDSIGSTHTSSDWDPFAINFSMMRGAVEQNGYWLTSDGRRVTLVEEYVSDRATGVLSKVGIIVEVPSSISLTPGHASQGVRVEPEFHGVYNPNDAAPVAGNDAFHAKSGEATVLHVLANDFDPEGREISLDGVCAPQHGHVVENKDNTITYFADPGYSGVDTFFYWAEDDQGNFTKAQVTITVDA